MFMATIVGTNTFALFDTNELELDFKNWSTEMFNTNLNNYWFVQDFNEHQFVKI